MVEVNGQTAFKLYPKSGAGRRTIPLPDGLLPILRGHITHYRPGRAGLVFPNQVGTPLHRTLFRSRIWRPTLVRSGFLGAVTELNPPEIDPSTGKLHCFRAGWTLDTGDPVTATFHTRAQAIRHVVRNAGEALRFHGLRHSYATWLVDDEVPPNMVQRVMGHEHVSHPAALRATHRASRPNQKGARRQPPPH